MKSLPLQPHPFRLLLTLEWILLGLVAFKMFGIPGWPSLLLNLKIPQEMMDSLLPHPHAHWWIIGLLGLFGATGLRLPTVRWAKIIYILLSLVLAGVIAFQGRGIDPFSPLLVILLLRISLLFQRRDSWTIITIVWLIYALIFGSIALVSSALLRSTKLQDWSSPAHGITVLADGSLKLNLQATATPEQVQQILAFAQHSFLYFIIDNVLSFGILLVFVLLLVNSLIKERQGRRQLALAHEKLYQYSLQIEDQATLQERTRIAREIHDSLGHLLTAQSVVLENTTLSLQTNAPDAIAFLNESKRLGNDARRELRQAILMLRSDPLQGKSLETAIADLTQDFSQSTGIQPQVNLHLPLALPDRYQVALYRILEEALTNIQKHSQATTVTVTVTLLPPNASALPSGDRGTSNRGTSDPATDTSPLGESLLRMQIIDNGQGFDLEQTRTGFGLQGMKERAESLSGQVRFSIQNGCCVTVILPLLGLTH